MHKTLALLLVLSACDTKKENPPLPGPSPRPTVEPPEPPEPPEPEEPIPGPPSEPPGGGDIVERQQFIVFHNLKRCWHSVSNITWDDELAHDARYLATSCKGSDVWNISYGTGSGIINALDAWYMEFLQFPFGAKDGNPQSARFSRMVWKDTAEIGCASNQCPQGFFVVCKYAPVGNLQGQYAKNVFRLKPDFMTCTGG